jgi:hypothetical protein
LLLLEIEIIKNLKKKETPVFGWSRDLLKSKYIHTSLIMRHGKHRIMNLPKTLGPKRSHDEKKKKQKQSLTNREN